MHQVAALLVSFGGEGGVALEEALVHRQQHRLVRCRVRTTQTGQHHHHESAEVDAILRHQQVECRQIAPSDRHPDGRGDFVVMACRVDVGTSVDPCGEDSRLQLIRGPLRQGDGPGFTKTFWPGQRGGDGTVCIVINCEDDERIAAPGTTSVALPTQPRNDAQVSALLDEASHLLWAGDGAVDDAEGQLPRHIVGAAGKPSHDVIGAQAAIRHSS
mmetsp:Transcript_42386/g.120207  ORF Transcript_42386/g.120207 Transcript_42386/m.120207 type:complete len:215 (-) Transcript_42386:278-922(-)